MNVPTMPQDEPHPMPAPTHADSRPDPWRPLLALVASRGVTLHAAVGKARGMRMAMAAKARKGKETAT